MEQFDSKKKSGESKSQNLVEENDSEMELEEGISDVFDDLEKQIYQKRMNEENNRDNITSQPYFCQLCGNKKERYSKVHQCKNCGISICNKCDSLNFCLNCWINLKEDARKSLKLLKFTMYLAPLTLLFMLYKAILEIINLKTYNFFYLFIFAEVTIIGISQFFFRFLRNRVVKYQNQYFDEKWIKIINTSQYKSKLDPYKLNRYIPEDIATEIQAERKESISNLKDWVESSVSLDDVPVPSHYNEIITESEKKATKGEKIAKIRDDLLANIQETEGFPYKLINQDCPACGVKIVFADFCPDCNTKFCPKCGKTNIPYERLCTCGYIFPSLKIEFFKHIEAKN